LTLRLLTGSYYHPQNTNLSYYSKEEFADQRKREDNLTDMEPIYSEAPMESLVW